MTPYFTLKVKKTFCCLVAVSSITTPILAQASKLQVKTEDFSEVVVGDGMIIKSESILNWRAACRSYVLSKPENSWITEVDCGEMKCLDTDFEIVCLSMGTKKVEYKGEKD